jgi:hypothetical protein
MCRKKIRVLLHNIIDIWILENYCVLIFTHFFILFINITLPIIAIAVDFVARQTIEQFDDIVFGNIIQ